MKKVLYPLFAIVVLGLLAVPTWAQKASGAHRALKASVTSHETASTPAAPEHSRISSKRSNKGGKVRGLERAEQVQAMNTKADANRGFAVASGVEKAETANSSRHGKRAPQTKAK